jgi:hypothetical protein
MRPILLVVLCLFASTTLADQLFVPSPEYPTIQAAVDAATDGDEVVLRDGVFTGPGNWDIDVPDVELVIRSESGDPLRTILELFEDGSDERHGGFALSGSGGSPVEIIGLTLQGGRSALLIDSRTVRVQACNFNDNRSFDDFGMGLAAGGAVCAREAHCEFQACRFTNNSVGSGGRGGSGSGGAVSISGGTASFSQCDFERNTAFGELEFGSASGGAVSTTRCMVTFDRCTFIANRIRAGFTVGGGLSAGNSDVVMVSCVFEGNQSNSSGVTSAGAFRVHGTLEMVGGRITSNTASDDMSFEGCCGGFEVRGEATFVNVRVSGNRVSSARCTSPIPGAAGGFAGAGAIFGTGEFVNCTINGNSANCWNGIYVDEDGDVQVLNSIVREAGDESVYAHPTATVDVRYSNIQGGDPGIGNIDADPRFEPGSYRLLSGSPCIDAGSTLLLPADEFDLDGDGDTAEPLPFDADGMARLADDPATPDTGVGFPVVDMGAFEYRPPCRVDLDGDGELTVFDFLAFFNAFDDGDPVADFDGDGAFTVFDFLAFQNEFDAGCD